MANETKGHYVHFCRLMRRWKNQVGFKFKGLLVDTMIKKFIDKDSGRKSLTFSDYYLSLTEIFKFLSEQDADCAYWLALGSNQQITNSDSGQFIKKAKKAYNKIKDIDEDSDEAIVKLQELFGPKFTKTTELSKSSSNYVGQALNEEFPENNFNVNIRYNLNLDYTVTQDGFRPKPMSYFIHNKLKLKAKKSLSFSVGNTDIPLNVLSKVEWYWKVRNIGIEAKRIDCERGQIFKGNRNHRETTQFSGSHYVECYAVIEGHMIARARVNVPIDTLHGSD